jgi:fused signal recognition particle receptor
LNTLLRDEIIGLLMENPVKRSAEFDAQFPETPHIILVVGVNGVGKTTTIGKLAHRYKSAGKSVLLGAADTFRAAAVDQLKIWSERANVPIIEQGQNADPAAVAFDTVAAAKARGANLSIIDTAGRLHNKKALMDELSKIKRVLSKVVPGAPHEVLLVLDASTGQNALQQARAFTEAVDITGLVLTKLDGTAKGGIVLGISHELSVPVKYIGLGEGMEDLQVFDKKAFVYALFGE